jgi:hypothetical protein
VDDLEHWNLHDEFTGHEAAALAVGLEPGRFYDEHGIPTMYSSLAYDAVAAAMDRAYGEARNMLDAMQTWGDGAWATWGHKLSSPDLLRSGAILLAASYVEDDKKPPPWTRLEIEKRPFGLARFSREELAKWFRARRDRFVPKYKFDRRAEAALGGADPQDKPLTTTERNTLLGIIAVVAVKKYRFDPSPNARLEMLGKLRADCETAGLPVSDDTLRSKLREAFALLPSTRPEV